jgi:hypothetical protein
MVEGWRKLHNDELQTSYFSASIIRMMKAEYKGINIVF